MKRKIVHTSGKAIETGPFMYLMAKRYKNDMLPYCHLTPLQIYDIIKKIPFRPDPLDVETLMRPYYTMNSMGYGGDCDDKSIAYAAYCELNKIPYYFVAVRKANRHDLHHVMLKIYLSGAWYTVDPTYSFNTFGRERERYAEHVRL